MKTIGEGESIVFRNGMAIKGTWKKESANKKTRWYNEQGDEIKLKAGKIWVEVVNQRGDVSYE